ncbi:hypothetical protein TRFO_21172 [Tritrichomonas foetus]|uniref:Uncharacterized protein n=1 Tax=Tritrichomonas foetus TaxID=1144522 RepID=A0A1J4KEE4_9EUKA|nr:hypothetical protein TRFO_21172 [Tritrichomonas foetus]|eukprot:OHT09809.1 hypothetical protein TRFO_21172 [Tritrichomonas foetus]
MNDVDHFGNYSGRRRHQIKHETFPEYRQPNNFQQTQQIKNNNNIPFGTHDNINFAQSLPNRYSPLRSNMNHNLSKNLNNSNNNSSSGNFTSKSISPLLLNIQQTHFNPLSTTIMRDIDPKKSIFPNKLKRIEYQLFDLRDEITINHEKVSSINGVVVPKASREIIDLKNGIELFSNHELLNKLQDVTRQVKEKSNEISNETQTQRDSTQKIENNIGEINGRIKVFKPSVDDTQELLNTSLSTIKADGVRNRQQINIDSEKISSLENLPEVYVKKANDFDNEIKRVHGHSNNNLNILVTQTDNLMTDIGEKLNNEIHRELATRNSLNSALKGQINELSGKVNDSINRATQNVNELKFRESYEQLNKQVNQALAVTKEEHNSQKNDLTNKFDSFLTDVENNFKAIRKEATDTIDLVKNKHSTSMKDIKDALDKESQVQKKNNTEYTNKINKFDDVIQKEKELQLNVCKQLFESMSGNLNQQAQNMTSPLQSDIQPLKEYNLKISEYEERINRLDSDLKNANDSIRKDVGQQQKQLHDIDSHLKTHKDYLNKEYDELEKRLDKLRKMRDELLNSPTKSDILGIQNQVSNNFEKNAKNIED